MWSGLYNRHPTWQCMMVNGSKRSCLLHKIRLSPSTQQSSSCSRAVAECSMFLLSIFHQFQCLVHCNFQDVFHVLCLSVLVDPCLIFQEPCFPLLFILPKSLWYLIRPKYSRFWHRMLFMSFLHCTHLAECHIFLLVDINIYITNYNSALLVDYIAVLTCSESVKVSLTLKNNLLYIQLGHWNY